MIPISFRPSKNIGNKLIGIMSGFSSNSLCQEFLNFSASLAQRLVILGALVWQGG